MEANILSAFKMTNSNKHKKIIYSINFKIKNIHFPKHENIGYKTRFKKIWHYYYHPAIKC